MIVKQLNKLCITKNCFLFGGHVYERMYKHPEKFKFRIMLSEDNYDYIVNKVHEQQLSRVFKSMRRK